MNRTLLMALAALAALPSAQAVCAARDRGPAVGISAGHAGVFDDLPEPGIASIEYRFETLDRLPLSPAVGIAAAENGALFVYADIHYDYWINEHWVLTPSLGAGRFKGNDDFDLGHLVEFRTGLEIAWEFESGHRLGLVLHHFSNGGLAKHNPGVEELSLTLSLPLGEP